MHCFFKIYKTIHYIDLLDGRSTFATQVGRAPFQGKRAGLINDRTCFTSSVKLYSQELEEMIQWVSGCLKRRRENLCALTLSFTQKKLSIYLDSTDSNALLLSTLSVAWNCGFDGKTKIVEAAIEGWNPIEYLTEVRVNFGSCWDPEDSGTTL